MTDAVVEATPAAIPEAVATPAVEPTTLITEAPAVETPEAAPIEYTEFTVPEGAIANPELNAEFLVAAKEAGLTQAQAQTLVDLGGKMQIKLMADNQANQAKQIETWAADARADKEIGGEKFNENLSIAKKGYDHIATPELKQILETTGLGNHPEMIRALHRVGSMLKEDGVVPGSTEPVINKNDAKSLYPNSNLN